MTRAEPGVWVERSALLALFVVLAALGLLSTGTHQDDDLTHFLFARDAWHSPRLLLDAWGRPGFTIPYSLVAWIGTPVTGLHLARLLSAALTTATVGLVLAAARRLTPNEGERNEPRCERWMAPALLAAMPLAMRLGFTTLTETVAALYVALGTWLITAGRTTLAALAFGLLPLARHEGVALLVGVAVWFGLRRDWRAAAALFVPLLVWNGLDGALFGEWPARVYVASRPDSVPSYGAGSATFYLLRWLEACGGAVVLLWAIGARQVVTRRRWRDVAALAAMGSLGWVALQTWLYARNTHASGGYARFLLPVTPWFALVAAEGVGPLRGALVGSGRARVFVTVAGVLGLVAAALWLDAERIHTLAGRVLDSAALTRADDVVAQAPWVAGSLAIGALAAARWRRAGFVLVGLVVALSVAQLALFLRPFRLTPRQQATREAVRALRESQGPMVPLVLTSIWISWFDRMACAELGVSAGTGAEGGVRVEVGESPPDPLSPVVTIGDGGGRW